MVTHYTKMLPLVIITCALTLVAHSSAAQSSNNGRNEDNEGNARNLWVKGYMKVKSALEAENENNRTMALDKFEQAKAYFVKVKKNYPNWHKDLVSYRLEFCNSKIDKLASALTSSDEELSREELAGKIQTLRNKNEKLKKKINSLQGNIKDLNQKVKEAKKAPAPALQKLEQKVGSLEKKKNKLSEKFTRFQRNYRLLEDLFKNTIQTFKKDHQDVNNAHRDLKKEKQRINKQMENMSSVVNAYQKAAESIEE